MISYQTYKMIHLMSLALLMLGLGGTLFTHLISPSVKGKVRLLCSAAHGVGLLMLLVSGFGLAARLGYVTGLPTWIYYKLAIWVFFGAALSISKRKANLAPLWLTVFTGVVGVAAYLAINKPV